MLTEAARAAVTHFESALARQASQDANEKPVLTLKEQKEPQLLRA